MKWEDANKLINEPSESEKEYLYYIQEEDREIIRRIKRKKELPAATWICKEMGYQTKTLFAILERMREGEDLYYVSCKEKSDGSRREICNPYRFLKKLQKRITEYFFYPMPVHKNAFGFSRGSALKAIRPHLINKSILCIDCKDAFPSVKVVNIVNFLTKGRISWFDPFHPSNHGIKRFGKFSWQAAKIIAEIITRNNSLPQGAPTSPIMFDLVCEELDRKLSNLAKNVKGKYTRYADNIFFSFPMEKFPIPLKHAILKTIEGKRRKLGPDFDWHKLQISKLNEFPIRMLGLNIIDGNICNTRDYKRRIRIRIHHVNWLLDHEMDYRDAWQKLHGLISYAVKETWPKKLREDYKELRKRVKTLKHKRRRYIKK